jgi:hypothetical protein
MIIPKIPVLTFVLGKFLTSKWGTEYKVVGGTSIAIKVKGLWLTMKTFEDEDEAERVCGKLRLHSQGIKKELDTVDFIVWLDEAPLEEIERFALGY